MKTNTKTATVAAPKATEIQAAWLKLLTRKSGATRSQLQEASGSPFPPDAWHLDRLAARFGFVNFVDSTKKSGREQIYQFVRPGETPTAFDDNTNFVNDGRLPKAIERKAAASAVHVMKRMDRAAAKKRQARKARRG